MVAVGGVRVEDRVGNDFADMAAGFGRRRVSDLVVDVRRRFLSACSSWYPLVLELHRLFIAFARAAVNDDGCSGVALHPTVWSSGGFGQETEVSAWEFAWVPGPVGLWRHGSISWPCIEVCDDDVGFWPYSVGLLVKLCSFLSSLHWPSVVDDFGVGVFRLLSFLFFMNVGLERGWSWRCLFLSCVVQFQCRLFLLDRALISGDLVGFWVRCFVL